MENERDHRQRMRRAVRKALIELGQRIRDAIRQAISVDVEVDVTGYVWRSEPGEPPRREKWELWKSYRYKVHAQAETMDDLTIYSTSKKAPWLEMGTVHIEPRPHFIVTIRKFGNLKAEFARLVAKFMKESDPVADSPSEAYDALDEPDDQINLTER